MKLLAVRNINLDYEKVGHISEERDALYRRIVFGKGNIDLFALFLTKFQTLAEIMSIKSTQQEATSVWEAQIYLENMRRGLDFVFSKVADSETIKEHRDIIYLHYLVEPDDHAKHPNSYRRTDVMVGNHLAPEPKKVYSLMNNLLFNLEEIKNPVVKAIFAHHEIVRIHPFVDGNGRIARLIMNWILMYYMYPPVFIKTLESRKNYIADLDLSFSHLEMEPDKHNDATDRFFADEIERVGESVEFLISFLLDRKMRRHKKHS